MSVAAALAVQTIIHNDDFLDSVRNMGQYMQATLQQELGSHPFFVNVRGRGMRFSLEYECNNQNEFGLELSKRIFDKYDIFTSIKWHRANFTPPLTLSMKQAEFILEAFVKEFKLFSLKWK